MLFLNKYYSNHSISSDIISILNIQWFGLDFQTFSSGTRLSSINCMSVRIGFGVHRTLQCLLTAFLYRLPKSHDAKLQFWVEGNENVVFVEGVNSSPNFSVTNLQSKTAIHLTTQLVFAKCESEISWVNRSQSPHLLFHLQLGHLSRNLTIQVLDLFTNQKKTGKRNNQVNQL